MEDTNRPEINLKVVWEVLPGDTKQVFRELNQEDIDPSLFARGTLVDTANFPTLPYPLLNPLDSYFDRAWTSTVIKIVSLNGEQSDRHEP